ncbi:MAG: FecR domain-containing protein [Acidobacteria bacterium]|nr:FecR domain-containing protein [Acidobacteriota bacterium]
MRTQRAVLAGTAVLPLFFLAALPAHAQQHDDVGATAAATVDASSTAPGDDQPAVAPARGATYARLREFEGGISLKREDENASQDVHLEVNSPLMPGDQVWTGEDGRLEIQLADGSLLRLDRNSRLSLLNLADREASFDDTTLIRLMNGSLYVRADNFDAHSRRFQIDTPAGSVFLLSGGSFRLDVGVDGVSTVASYRGVAEILADDVSVMAHSGERATAEPGRRPSDARAFNTLHRDPFDEWVESRDDSYASADSRRGPRPEVPDQVAPYAGELNRYGTWRDDSNYGWVWQPAGVAPDWRPYYYGSWYNAPIGATWVSSEPWGWAPYHYGRWQWALGLGWFWAPGIVYSGAYVSWSVGPSYYGWCPLGYYNSPVVIAGGGFGFVYVPHTYLYSNGVHHHTYGYSDVARYRLEQNAVPMRGNPSWRAGARPELTGATSYRRAVVDARLGPARQPLGAGSSTAAPFSVREKETYRRATLEHQASMRRSSDSTPRAAGPRGLDSRPVDFKWRSARYSQSPGVARQMRPSAVAPDEPASPATGRPMHPPLRMLPESGRRSTAINPWTPGEKQINDSTADNPNAARQDGNRGQSSIARPPQADPRATSRPTDSGPAPHPRADVGRYASGGQFVMPDRPAQPGSQRREFAQRPNHPTTGGAPGGGYSPRPSRPTGAGSPGVRSSQTPSHPTPRPQAAERGKGGGHRK